MSNKIHIVTCDGHGQEVIIHNGNIIYQDDCSTEVLWRIAGHLDIEITFESISDDEYEKRYA